MFIVFDNSLAVIELGFTIADMAGVTSSYVISIVVVSTRIVPIASWANSSVYCVMSPKNKKSPSVIEVLNCDLFPVIPTIDVWSPELLLSYFITSMIITIIHWYQLYSYSKIQRFIDPNY